MLYIIIILFNQVLNSTDLLKQLTQLDFNFFVPTSEASGYSYFAVPLASLVVIELLQKLFIGLRPIAHSAFGLVRRRLFPFLSSLISKNFYKFLVTITEFLGGRPPFFFARLAASTFSITLASAN